MTVDVRAAVVNVKAMLLVRRLRSIRSLPFILLVCLSLLLLLCQYTGSPLPTPKSAQAEKPEPPAQKYQSTPTYEHSSPYRRHANFEFETALEGQLQLLEKQLRGALPASEQDLIANHTIWQIAEQREAAIWKVWVKQWRKNNPDWTYELFTMDQIPTDTLSLFASVPEIARAYEELPDLRKDLLRYLILWYHGGFFAEIDTWNRVSMKNCFSIEEVVQRRRDISLMLGIELDEPYWNPETKAAWHWSRSFGFGQFAVWAPKRFDPIIRRAIVRAIAHMRTHSRIDKAVLARSGNQVNIGEVSGASMFTDVVLEVLSENLVADHAIRDRDAGLERRVTWKRFKHLKDVAWIEGRSAAETKEDNMRGVAILPINVWASGQRHSGSRSFDEDMACINHVYGKQPRGSFKLRFLQTIFG
ncbi:hypothetical protein BP6252_03903 [Coleophoma cylindrospora]|uniref:Glycosyltransferase family 32 protein n=1 Tax=Coleophoma cylindrospora TaxID=1849047 RepID=A0A3D8S9H5_9HELO|nr:hypothetical protein BP6252_03903 [Coleophoma cylindrospora]